MEKLCDAWRKLADIHKYNDLILNIMQFDTAIMNDIKYGEKSYEEEKKIGIFVAKNTNSQLHISRI